MSKKPKYSQGEIEAASLIDNAMDSIKHAARHIKWHEPIDAATALEFAQFDTGKAISKLRAARCPKCGHKLEWMEEEGFCQFRNKLGIQCGCTWV